MYMISSKARNNAGNICLILNTPTLAEGKQLLTQAQELSQSLPGALMDCVEIPQVRLERRQDWSLEEAVDFQLRPVRRRSLVSIRGIIFFKCLTIKIQEYKLIDSFGVCKLKISSFQLNRLFVNVLMSIENFLKFLLIFLLLISMYHSST